MSHFRARSGWGHPAQVHPRVRRYAGDGFRAPPKKSLGQHFLHERGVVDRIIHAVDPKPGDRLVEIGPGQGAMTFPLLERHGAPTAIEFDRDLLQPLADAARAHGELTLVHANVLDVDFSALAAGTPSRSDGQPTSKYMQSVVQDTSVSDSITTGSQLHIK